MRVEQIVRGVPAAFFREPDDIDQQFREGVTGHRAIGAALHFEIQKQPAVTGQDRQRPQRSILLEAAQRGDLFQSGPILMLEHYAGRIVHHDFADHRRREHNR